MTRKELAKQIEEKLRQNLDRLRHQWNASHPVRHFFIDDVLPTETVEKGFQALPDPSTLMLRASVKEHKHVGVDVEKYAPLVGDMLYAFQDEAVMAVISEITGIKEISADRSLYGSGISMMLQDDFLLPHLDNSHDGDGSRYRVLNALYYISPGWPDNAGGNLELWGPEMSDRREVHARFNRLVMMETNTRSVHSVSKIKHSGVRACVSNYYFAKEPADAEAYVHKTTFFARPEDGLAKKVRLRAEGTAKNMLSRLLDNKTMGTKHRRQ